MAASGCAALIYEVVWLQLLQFVIGSAAISLALLLASYMGGLCLGSAILPRIVSPRRHPLRVYALLELGIGIAGVLALFGIPLLGRIYVAGPTHGIAGLLLRGFIAGVCLLPPTLLMGGTLPAVARWIGAASKNVSALGFLYSSNIAGAVFGCLFAGFYLLRVHDVAIASYFAASINLGVALISFVLARRAVHPRAVEASSRDSVPHARGAALVYIVIALSGLCALGAEVVWTRLLSLLLGATVYTFSIILAVFLFGLWAGSGLGSLVTRRVRHPRLALAGCQLLVAASVAWAGYTLSHSLPYWPIDPWLSLDSWFNFEIDLLRCAWTIFPATLLWGASFPLALASVTQSKQDPGRLSGEVYAANTAGAILGGLVFSLFLIPSAGTREAQQLLIGFSMIAAVIAAIPAEGGRSPRYRRVAALAASGIVSAWALTRAIAEIPWEVVAYGRRVAPMVRAVDLYPDQAGPMKVLYRGEGINSTLLIADKAGERQFYVSGKAEASTAPVDMRLQRMMGHVPALIHPRARSVLTVGFGTGVTAGSFTLYPELERLVICELEPLIPPASAQYFAQENYGVFNDRRTQMVYDDARHYVLTTPDTFDIITTDPIHPWVKGASTLYTKEYYELVKRHLNPGGVVAQWLPLYDSDAETVKTELATFFDVFPDGTVWSNNMNGEGYDLILIGQAGATLINVDELQQRLERLDYLPVYKSIGEVGFHNALNLAASYVGRASDLRPFLGKAQINQDLNLRLQYLAGLGLNSMTYPKIYREILAYRRFPDGVLVGSAPRINALTNLLQPPR